jgi:hypothetical protein
MIVKTKDTRMIDFDFKKYLFKKKIYRYLLELNYITLEEYEKSIVQLEEKYNSKN